MKFTVDRIENNIAICECEENSEIIKKEIPLSEIPFDVTEGTIFTATKNSNTIIYELTENDELESDETKQRVRSKLNKLFGRK